MNEALLGRARDLTAAYSIRFGRPTTGDARSFTALFNATYARPVTEAYYYWQFFEAPQPGICLMAEAEGQIGAVYGLRCLHVSAPSGVAVGQTVDLIIRPDLRGTGLWLRLEAEMENWARANKCAAIWAMPNAAAYRSRVAYLGWQSLGERVVHVAPTGSHRIHFDMEFDTLPVFGQETSQIIHDFASQHRQLIWFERSPDYLNWRFTRNPVHQYKLVLARRAQIPFAYLVLKTFLDPLTGNSSGDIVDLFWSKDDTDALADVLNFALDQFYRAGVGHSALWLDTGTVLDSTASAAGFRPGEQHRKLICKVLDPSANWLVEPSRWLVTLSDSEIY